MNNFRLGVFDLFSYIVPGLFYIILVALSLNILNMDQLIKGISSISFFSFLAFLLAGYLIGFAFDGIASKYYKITIRIIRGELEIRVLEHFKKENPDSKIDEYNFGFIYAFADVYSPDSREKADQFSALANMSRNLSLCFLCYAIITLADSLFHISTLNWIFVPLRLIGAVFVSYIFLSHADRFRSWSHIHLLYSYYIVSEGSRRIKKSIVNKKQLS